MAADKGVSATSGGEAVDVRSTDAGSRGITTNTGRVAAGVEARSSSGEPVKITNTDEDAPEVDPMNPLGEPELDVEAQVDFYHQGVLRRAGDRFPMAESQARAAAQFIRAVTEDGLRPVPHRDQKIANVPRANVAGLARHERISAFEDELKSLDARREVVLKAIAHEKEQADADKAAAEKRAAERAKS